MSPLDASAMTAGLPVMLRAAGAALLAPGFTEMPLGLRLGLAAMAGLIALPLGTGQVPPPGSWLAWAPAELLAGACIGGVAASAVLGLRWMGRLAGEQMGLAVGATYAPDADPGETNAVESVMGWCAAACFVAVGGIDAVVLAAVRSRAAGAGDWIGSARGLATTMDAALQVGLRACLPVLAVTIAGTLIGGVVIRAAPRVVTLAGGFGVRAAMGLGMLTASAGAAWALQQELLRDTLGRLATGGAW